MHRNGVWQPLSLPVASVISRLQPRVASTSVASDVLRGSEPSLVEAEDKRPEQFDLFYDFHRYGGRLNPTSGSRP